ncbi:hypothetical protein G7070_08835 [Propioniciclava coleopterorum]|uniref:Carbohydrate kinase FGGY N-terminal domain-containing protein n=1 Tax=Propioniciclava coleopterorum TaxID=2714937 RepID=A0A6G7Y6T5_9ACTN|nr:hypothetical protein G7070_08835 [Propioniciclava coleopterorum]
MTATLDVTPAQATGPFVLALDVGSSGTRSGLYDARARPVRKLKAKRPHAFRTLANGTSTIDPDQVTEEIGQAIDDVLAQFDGPIAGVALDTFASSLVGVDADGAAITPCYTYADSRCAPQVNYLKSILNEDDTQQRTGTRQHTGYLPPRFLWLQQNDPRTFDRVRRWMSLGEYAWLKLIGTTAAGTSTAAWTGMLDRRNGTWDTTLCDLVGVDREQLSPIASPLQPLEPRRAVGKRWPQLADAVWFAPISDGHSQSIGAGSVDASTAVLSAATSGAFRVLVSGDLDNLPAACGATASTSTARSSGAPSTTWAARSAGSRRPSGCPRPTNWTPPWPPILPRDSRWCCRGSPASARPAGWARRAACSTGSRPRRRRSSSTGPPSRGSRCPTSGSCAS